MKKILFIFGTRPEAIKMAPLIREFRLHKSHFEVKVYVTAQHRKMLDRVLAFFKIKPDYDLGLMKKNQTLFDITSSAIKSLGSLLKRFRPDLILVQGDTTSAFAGALSGYYKQVKVGHVEAGLRSNNKYSPFPEEMNRILAGHISDFHFAPTAKAREYLSREGIKKNVWVVGNTVIDALFLGLKIINKEGGRVYNDFFKYVDFKKKVILVTGHRRESFGEPFRNICRALKKIAKENNVEVIYPVHLNPNVRKPVYDILKDVRNIHLIEPLSYPYLIWLMNKSYFVLTDSGGIQEEAPSLGKPVLVMRNVTERTEGIGAGNARLVGTDMASIVRNALLLLRNYEVYKAMSKAGNPYGDGKTSKRIVDIVKKALK